MTATCRRCGERPRHRCRDGYLSEWCWECGAEARARQRELIRRARHPMDYPAYRQPVRGEQP